MPYVCFECLHHRIIGGIFGWSCKDAIGGPVVDNKYCFHSVKTSNGKFPSKINVQYAIFIIN